MTLVDATTTGKCKELRPRMTEWSPGDRVQEGGYLPGLYQQNQTSLFFKPLNLAVSPLYQLSLIWVTLFGEHFIFCIFQFLICKE